MAWQTPKTNWAAGDGVANGDLNRIEENVRMLSQSAGAFGTCTGSANAYSVTASPPLTSLSEGSCVAVKINVTNTAGSTINVNGLGAKAIKRGNGLDVAAGQLKADSIYTLRYNGVNFTLQGEGGEYGNAQPQHVLSPYTIGTENGVVPGTIPSKGAATITPGTSQQKITAGQYLSGDQTVDTLGGNAAAADVRADKAFSSNSAGRAKQGSMPVNGSQTAIIQITGAGKPTKSVPAGYSPGGTITAELAAALASIILQGNTIGGVAGTLAPGKKWATGTVTDTHNISVSGLAFTPSLIMVYSTKSGAGSRFDFAIGSLANDIIRDHNNVTTKSMHAYYSMDDDYVEANVITWTANGFSASMFNQWEHEFRWYAFE